jgi:hypothetical protein
MVLSLPLFHDESRPWHDRRSAEGEVPEKIRKISGWKRAMKDFLNSDNKLNELVALFTQKFVQLGQSRNFTITTLTDMAWTVLVLTWEAVIEQKLPSTEGMDVGWKDKYEELKQQMSTLRMQFLQELSELRDRERQAALSPPMQAALSEISADAAMSPNGVYRFQPELAMDEETRAYFQAAMVENMKIAMTKGAAAANDTMQVIAKQLKDTQQELEDVKSQLDQANLKVKLAEGGNETEIGSPMPKPFRREIHSSHATDNAEVKRMKVETEELKQKLDTALQENNVLRTILTELGIDVTELDLHGDWRKQMRRFSLQDTALAAEAEKKWAQQVEDYEQRLALLEKKLKDVQRAHSDKATETDRLQSNQKDLEAKNADLEKQLALLKKSSSGAQRISALEGEVSFLVSELESVKQELEVKKTETEAVKKELDQAKGEMTQLRKDLKVAQKALEAQISAGAHSEELRRRSKEEDDKAEQDETDKAAQLSKKVSKLENRIKQVEEERESFKQQVKALKAELEEAKLMRKALEQAMEELQKKFNEFKQSLQDQGVDVSKLDKALAMTGMVLANPKCVFDRLYTDALRRHAKINNMSAALISQQRERNPSESAHSTAGGHAEARTRSRSPSDMPDTLADVRFGLAGSPRPSTGRDAQKLISRAVTQTSTLSHTRPSSREGKLEPKMVTQDATRLMTVIGKAESWQPQSAEIGEIPCSDTTEASRFPRSPPIKAYVSGSAGLADTHKETRARTHAASRIALFDQEDYDDLMVEGFGTLVPSRSPSRSCASREPDETGSKPHGRFIRAKTAPTLDSKEMILSSRIGETPPSSATKKLRPATVDLSLVTNVPESCNILMSLQSEEVAARDPHTNPMFSGAVKGRAVIPPVGDGTSRPSTSAGSKPNSARGQTQACTASGKVIDVAMKGRLTTSPRNNMEHVRRQPLISKPGSAGSDATANPLKNMLPQISHSPCSPARLSTLRPANDPFLPHCQLWRCLERCDDKLFSTSRAELLGDCCFIWRNTEVCLRVRPVSTKELSAKMSEGKDASGVRPSNAAISNSKRHRCHGCFTGSLKHSPKAKSGPDMLHFFTVASSFHTSKLALEAPVNFKPHVYSCPTSFF